MRKRIVLLGASGSIGTQTIDVIDRHADRFELVGFSVGTQVDKAIAILRQHPVKMVCLANADDAANVATLFPDTKVVCGDEGLLELCRLNDYDVLVNALVGYVGLKPTVEAICQHKQIALANKETLVIAGEVVMQLAKANGVSIVPIDSEHSAIFQCLQSIRKSDIRNLWITASGGAFRTKKHDELADVTVKDALAHPNWKMGAKITVDSATMVNKGFEIIEAHWLFDIPYDQIHPLYHPQSIVHSMVECVDGATMAQLGSADMRVPIQYALTYPDRFEIDPSHDLNWFNPVDLHFEPLSLTRYPLLKCCLDMANKGNIFTSVLNAANEVANQAFRNGDIGYYDLENVILATCAAAKPSPCVTLESLWQAQQWAFGYATDLIYKERCEC